MLPPRFVAAEGVHQTKSGRIPRKLWTLLAMSYRLACEMTHRHSTRPIGIDLFAGAGGLSLGFEQAGFDIAAAVEVDPVHCAVHKFNFPRTAIIAKSAERTTGDEIRGAAGIGHREIDCVFGGAPCQGFSLIGQRDIDDPRNKLVRDFVRIVSELDARTFVFENVKGLTVGKHRKVLDDLIAEFSAAGYEVRLPWQILNSAHYATPQNRERLFLIGARKGEALPDYPEPKTAIGGGKAKTLNPTLSTAGASAIGGSQVESPCPASSTTGLSAIGGMQAELHGLPSGPTCADALSDLPDADCFLALIDSDAVATSAFHKPSPYAASLRMTTDDAWHYGYARDWNPELLTSSARTRHTEISRRRFATTEPGEVEPISRFFKLAKDGVANTLRAGTDGARGAFTSPRPIHYQYDRCITVREMARLHGFPDWFRFHATKWHGARQVGNSVPPPLDRAIAEEVARACGAQQTRPEGTLALGGPELLRFDMSGAASHFGVKASPNRRDRKSGAKKRKQIDIERESLAGELAA